MAAANTEGFSVVLRGRLIVSVGTAISGISIKMMQDQHY